MEPMKAYIIGGIPDRTPKTERIAELTKPLEKSLQNIAIAMDAGVAISIESRTTRKVPHKAGTIP
jgi:hypothetical protein